MSEVPSITLRGAAPHTANMARIMPDGSLEVELFDFSPEAHQWLGNDVAYIVRVSPQDAPAVAARSAFPVTWRDFTQLTKLSISAASTFIPIFTSSIAHSSRICIKDVSAPSSLIRAMTNGAFRGRCLSS